MSIEPSVQRVAAMRSPPGDQRGWAQWTRGSGSVRGVTAPVPVSTTTSALVPPPSCTATASWASAEMSAWVMRSPWVRRRGDLSGVTT